MSPGARKPTLEIPYTLAEIKFTITCLYKLPLRDPAPLDRYVSKDSGDMSIYQHFDILYVKDKFPFAESNLVTRLGKLVTRRRQLLASRSAHDQRLLPETTDSVESSKATSTRNGPPDILPSNDARVPEQAAIARNPQSHVSGGKQTVVTKASIKHEDANQDHERKDNILERTSEYAPSMASSYAAKLRVKVPNRPRDGNGEELLDFKCPYCFIAGHVETRELWK